ncbi:hypothetical protein Bra3105_06515 [Brachybacterium halotolerans subsp. kimchii]|uniref:hypothetical protein n=1 Tax=Brachybacterium halotolerans TaxID=2795215 RepID=UPI001E46FE90|nr:hypothetical protein [Brachybacterium halotolerans]UEJ83959.1 hypothetical protein Bra3105_06515 [Brachybacterium halotolerans subsp. kimchii]
MSALTEKEHIADYSTDGMNSRELLRDVSIPDEVADKAWAVLKRMCPRDADELGQMLGVVAHG